MSNVEETRKNFIEHALNEIRSTPHYGNFYLHTYYVIAKLGLQHKAKVEGLFETVDWNDTECRDAIVERIKHFLFKNIR
ncbi:hypothetical protein LCGC14_1544020 [marine sediment metagenome]|uniref:Uncharacterized protein n=1 Tax=marine sediment metagenome TaxID=412755 RepID=A0A0F9IS91_9ZZZZ